MFDDQHFRFPILGMLQLIAALPGFSLLLQNAVHRAGGAKIRALVQQGGKDLAGSPVLKAFRVQLVQDHLPLGGSQGTRRSRSRRCHGLRIGAELPVQRCVRGMLARTLLARQHEVTWWTSGFNHSAKCHRTPRTASVTTAKGIRLTLLRGVAYSRNICIARLVNHYQLAREFMRECDSEPKPDLIFCCWPTIELGFAAVRYACRRSVPVVLDVRDLWPDVYLAVAPRPLQPLARALLAPYLHMTRSAFRRSSAIVGISEGYLEWGLAHAGRPRGPWDAVFPLGYREPDLSRPPAPEQQEQLRSLGVDESRLLCWFLGSFGDTYDLESVILAARELKSRGLGKYQFVLSGVGGNRAHCERLASGLDNVVFTGWLNEGQITCMMRMARFGIAAYRAGAPQGLPNKIFEYMAAGLPILSSLTGESQEFLEANACGVFYRPGDAGSLVTALLALTTSENRRTQLGANALGAFRSRYSASILYPQLVDHLEHIVAAWEHKRPCSAAAA